MSQITEIEQLKRENKELARQLKIRDELSCGTCHGVGSVMIAIDDGMDFPECEALENKIKADAAISEIKRLQDIMGREFGDRVACFLSLYADKLRGKTK